MHNIIYGAGLGYRNKIKSDILECKNDISVLECVFEQFKELTPDNKDLLKILAAHYKITLHALNLSIGSPQIDFEYLIQLKKIVRFLGLPYVTDHLAITNGPGVVIGHLTPVSYTEESLEICIQKINFIQSFIEVPLLLENITASFEFPHNSLSESEFLTLLTSRTGCGTLLDVTNIYTNAMNRGLVPLEEMKKYPLDSIGLVHLAGGLVENGEYVDSHSELISEEIWELFEHLVQLTRIHSCVIEHDANFPDFELLNTQVKRIAECMKI